MTTPTITKFRKFTAIILFGIFSVVMKAAETPSVSTGLSKSDSDCSQSSILQL